MFRSLAILSVVIITGVVGWHFYTQAKLLADYCFNVVGHRIIRASWKEIVMQMDFQVYNKSDISIVVDNYDLGVYINKHFVSKVSNPVGQTLAPNSRSIITLIISFTPKQALGGIFNLDFIKGAMDKQKIMIGLSGFVTVSHQGIRLKNLPVQIEMPLSEMIPKPGEDKPC